MERLQKVIAASGICSRRKAEELIADGKVKVNGRVTTTLGTKVSAEDTIVVDNKKINIEDKVYYILNKPRNVISSVSDEHDRVIVTNLIKEKKRIFPVGRLDYDTTGLIILTNDGELANILMHPSNEVEKTYVAKVEGKITMDDLFKIKGGVDIEGSKITPALIKIKAYDKDTNTSIVKIILVEGQNHVVKNIFNNLGYQVIKLKRETYGFLTLGALKSGDYRKLTKSEVKELYEYKK